MEERFHLDSNTCRFDAIIQTRAAPTQLNDAIAKSNFAEHLIDNNR